MVFPQFFSGFWFLAGFEIMDWAVSGLGVIWPHLPIQKNMK